MAGDDRMAGSRIAVTGAAGFIGRAVVAAIERGVLGAVADLRLNDVALPERAGATAVRGSFADPVVRERLLSGGVDVLFHLASVPGGAAEAEVARGRAVNLDATLALLDAAAAACDAPPVIVYTSSIAALGLVGRGCIDRDTPLRPGTSYGAHKAMVELYIADLTRRGVIDGRSLRPAGIVARPPTAYAGFATAWMSEMFRSAHAGRDMKVPWRETAHVWLQSVDAVANAIVHAATLAPAGLPPERVWTLPATVARLDILAAAMARNSSGTGSIAFGDGGIDQPPLDAGDALALGFRGDGDVDALVKAVFRQLDHETLAGPDNIP